MNNTKALKAVFSESTINLINKKKELKQLMYAIYTREHLLLTGRTGTGKSQLSCNVLDAIKGVKVFKAHLSKQTTEELVFGPLNIIELKKGNIEYNIQQGGLPCHFWFLDEFFDASDVILRSLLGVLNERKWLKARGYKAKLHSAILTSNYTRENEVTEAVLDRIIFKAKILPLSGVANRVKAYSNFLKKGNGHKPRKLITYKKIKEFADLVENPKSVVLPRAVLRLYDKLVDEYVQQFKSEKAEEFTEKKKDFYISQRTLNKALKVVKCATLLDNRTEAILEDLAETKYVFCTTNDVFEEEIFDATFDKIVGKAMENQEREGELMKMAGAMSKFPTDFKHFKTDDDLIEAVRELNSYAGLLNVMGGIAEIKKSRRLYNIMKRLEMDVTNLKKSNQKYIDKLFKKKVK